MNPGLPGPIYTHLKSQGEAAETVVLFLLPGKHLLRGPFSGRSVSSCRESGTGWFRVFRGIPRMAPQAAGRDGKAPAEDQHVGHSARREDCPCLSIHCFSRDTHESHWISFPTFCHSPLHYRLFKRVWFLRVCSKSDSLRLAPFQGDL